MTIKNIIFDVGNVFITWDPYVVFQRHFEDRGAVVDFFKEIDFDTMNLNTDKGMPFRVALDKAIEKHPQYKHIFDAYDREWIDTITGEVPGTVDLTADLKEKGYKIYALSNFSREKFDVCIAKYKFDKHFDGLVVSADVCEAKPEEAIYKILLSKYNLKPEESVFLDDRQDNLDTAQRLGFHTILFTTAGDARKQLYGMGVKV